MLQGHWMLNYFVTLVCNPWTFVSDLDLLFEGHGVSPLLHMSGF